MSVGEPFPAFTLRQLQERIRTLFGSKDRRRGVEGTFMWFMEEVGELAAALRDPDCPRDNLAGEFADVLAWLATLANIAEVDLDAAIHAKYGSGCPKCRSTPCACGTAKP
jgi:NTP pyrophosphatase (non-canonical NTP hydrolase)